jgi:hypothetical protein
MRMTRAFDLPPQPACELRIHQRSVPAQVYSEARRLSAPSFALNLVAD